MVGTFSAVARFICGFAGGSLITVLHVCPSICLFVLFGFLSKKHNKTGVNVS